MARTPLLSRRPLGVLSDAGPGDSCRGTLRMLGSFQDAEHALQDTLLADWQGLGGFTRHDLGRAGA
jgi:hypothetical protein